MNRKITYTVLLCIFFLAGCKEETKETKSDKISKDKTINETIIGKYYEIKDSMDISDDLKYIEFTDENYYSVRNDKTLVNKYSIDKNNIIIDRSFIYKGSDVQIQIVYEFLNDSTLVNKSTNRKFRKIR